MKANDYWQANRQKMKKTIVIIVGTKELFETAWQIYGATLRFSKEMEYCGDDGHYLTTLMTIILIVGAFKLLLLVIIGLILIYVGISKVLLRRKERSASKEILRTLSKIKYSALAISSNADNTDEVCSICFVEYKADDIIV